ncbi:amidohydrolase family protein [Polymorphobacter sp.]|uniref:amidohydrolase family protein n=1 Tax=Polymorphobacter sp. TaxID=1909290 RepID=UPI003F6F1B38
MRMLRAAAMVVALVAAAPAAADQIIVNANGYTLGVDGELQRFASLVLDNDGRVKALLPAGAPLPRGRHRDMGGRTLLPGLVDAHGRLTAAATTPDRRGRERAWAAAVAAASAAGVTMVHDAGTTAESWTWLKRQRDRRRLPLRVHAMADGPQQLAAIAADKPIDWDKRDMLAARSMTLTLDGDIADHQAWLKADYADSPGRRGQPLIEEGRLRRQVLAASMQGFQVDIEAHGDAALGAALSALGAVPDAQRALQRHRVSVVRLLGADEIDRFNRLGVVAVVAPVLPAQPAEAAVLGARRAAALAGWAKLADTGAIVAGGTGGAATVLAAIPAATSAVKDKPLAGLDMFTRLAARAGHAETRAGILAPGYWGDFIILDRDPLATTQTAPVQVLETWLAGRRVYRRAG